MRARRLSMMAALAGGAAVTVLLAACSGGAPAAPAGYQMYESPALDYSVAIPAGWELYLHHEPTRTDYFGPPEQRFKANPPLSIRYLPDSAVDVDSLIDDSATEEGMVAGQRAAIFITEGELDQRYAYFPIGSDTWLIRLIFPKTDAESYPEIFEAVLNAFELGR